MSESRRHQGERRLEYDPTSPISNTAIKKSNATKNRTFAFIKYISFFRSSGLNPLPPSAFHSPVTTMSATPRKNK